MSSIKTATLLLLPKLPPLLSSNVYIFTRVDRTSLLLTFFAWMKSDWRTVSMKTLPVSSFKTLFPNTWCSSDRRITKLATWGSWNHIIGIMRISMYVYNIFSFPKFSSFGFHLVTVESVFSIIQNPVRIADKIVKWLRLWDLHRGGFNRCRDHQSILLWRDWISLGRAQLFSNCAPRYSPPGFLKIRSHDNGIFHRLNNCH